ncbi:MAG TPA: histone deacetylase [Rariglobus sp.]
MLPFRLIYFERYDLNLGAHVFPSQKYRWIAAHLLRTGFATHEDFLAPTPATDADMRLAHDARWVEKLRTGMLTAEEIARLEIPYSPELIHAIWHATGGTILACQLALGSGIGFNLGGGFHHAFPGHGEGFCAINDIAVAIRRLQHDGAIRRAMVVDCDVHHGNGTAAIFADDPSVFTLSLHQRNNYPAEKPPSDLDVHLDDGTGDEEYLALLDNALTTSLARFTPDLMLYVAGADPYRDDQLGGLALSFDGLMARDRLVLATARQQGIPVAVVLAGGYARVVEDTVLIHANTATVARDVVNFQPRL